jgi:hypothetical protein
MSNIGVGNVDRLYRQSIRNLGKDVRLRDVGGQLVYAKRDTSLGQRASGTRSQHTLKALRRMVQAESKTAGEARQATAKALHEALSKKKRHQLRPREACKILWPMTTAGREFLAMRTLIEKKGELAKGNKQLSKEEEERLDVLKQRNGALDAMLGIFDGQKIKANGQRIFAPGLETVFDHFLEKALTKEFWSTGHVAAMSPVLSCGLALTVVRRIVAKKEIEKSDIVLLNRALAPPYDRSDHGDLSGPCEVKATQAVVSLPEPLQTEPLDKDNLRVIMKALYANFIAADGPEKLNFANAYDKTPIETMAGGLDAADPEAAFRLLDEAWTANANGLDIREAEILAALQAATAT